MSIEPQTGESAHQAFIGFYPTPDLEATHRFYGDTLGLRLARDQGKCRIYHVAGGGHLGFCLSPQTAAPQPDPRVILTIVTDDVDGVYQRLQAAGTELEGAPKHNPDFAIYHFYARGPHGERLEVQRFDEPLE